MPKTKKVLDSTNQDRGIIYSEDMRLNILYSLIFEGYKIDGKELLERDRRTD